MKQTYEAIMVGLIFVSIALIVLDCVVELGAMRDSVYLADLAICAILALDYAYRLLRSERKASFIRKYWYEILALIPAYLFLIVETQFLGAIFRSLRIIRAARILRLTKLTLAATRIVKLITTVSRLFIRSKVAYLLALAFTIIMFSSTAIYAVEAELENTSIKSFFDAVWWSFTTVTTVGYGDIVPSTIEGKTIGIMLMISGIIVWSGIISLLTTAIIERKQEKPNLKQELKTLVKKYIDKEKQLTTEEKHLLQKILKLTLEH
ncbi:MAG: hypothetical protein B6U76_01245 [Desulfurococcales archaeon ex4484_217_2]|nr:MAG: hypothetical protein B6U76_01245 [Desulfurococcales archaeon ex4484_217_2]